MRAEITYNQADIEAIIRAHVEAKGGQVKSVRFNITPAYETAPGYTPAYCSIIVEVTECPRRQ